jgi:group I intron endonuclease
MVGKRIIIWTKEKCIEEAKKYKSRGDFSEKNHGAYKAALRNNWLDEVFPKPEKVEEGNNTSGIYILRNKINNKKYIGQAINLRRRHINFLCETRKYGGHVIDNARKKYGPNAFEYSILTHCPTEELNYWEAFYVERLKTTTPNGYNMTNGGDSVVMSTEEYKKGEEEKLKEFILSKNPNLDVSNVKYENNFANVTIVCPKHGSFKKSPNAIKNRQTHHLLCPKCVKEAEIETFKKIFLKKAKKKFNGKYSYEKSKLIQYNKNIIVTCPIHGDFKVLPTNHLSKDKRGGGCPKCSKERHHDEAMLREGDILKKIILEKTNGKILLDKYVYRGNKEKVTLICPKHGEFTMMPHNIKLSKAEMCPECITEGILKRRTKKKHGIDVDSSTKAFIVQAKKTHKDKYDYSKVVYKKAHDKICIICHEKDKDGKEHGEFWQTPNNHLSGYGCPKCATITAQKDRRRTIEQLDMEGNVINTWHGFNSIDIGKPCSKSHIISCCTGRRNNAYGYKWRYADDEEKKTEKKIRQLDKDRNLIRIWNNISEIHKEKPVKSTQHVKSCLNGKIKTAGGYRWEYCD